MATATATSLRQRREEVVWQNVNAEKQHDVEGTLASFHHPRYEVMPLGLAHVGEAAVRELLNGLFVGFPDFSVDVQSLHHADAAVILEVRMTGTHRGPWAGLDATGCSIDVPAACIFEFDGDHLLCEKVYFDFATLHRQLTTSE